MRDADRGTAARGPRQHSEARLLDHVLTTRTRALAAAERASLAHDLGKLVTFRQEGTRWVRVSPLHSRLSAILLVTLPQRRRLPVEDQEDLIVAAAFHHALQELPDTARPRPRALLGLLRQADHAASARKQEAP